MYDECNRPCIQLLRRVVCWYLRCAEGGYIGVSKGSVLPFYPNVISAKYENSYVLWYICIIVARCAGWYARWNECPRELGVGISRKIWRVSTGVRTPTRISVISLCTEMLILRQNNLPRAANLIRKLPEMSRNDYMNMFKYLSHPVSYLRPLPVLRIY